MRARSLAAGLATLLAAAVAGCDRADVVSPTATLTSSAGTVDVQCIGRSRIQIVGSEAAAGYTARVIVDGPTHQGSLVFESPNANDFKIMVHCTDARAFLVEIEIEDTTLTG